MTEKQVLARLDAVEKHLREAASRPARPPEAVFASGERGFGTRDVNQWPVERLKQLGAAYGGGIEFFARKGNGRPRLSGIGPALVKLAALSGNPEAKAIARANGVPDSYGAEQLEREYGFTGVMKAATRGVSGPKWGMGGAEVRKIALNEGSGQTGGYLVPPQFLTELMSISAEDAVIEPRVRSLPMTSRTAQWPMLDVTTNYGTGVTPYFGGIQATWQPEASTIAETEPQFKQSEWVAWDLVLYTVTSNQLLADNGIGLDALITQLFGQAITWYKEYAFLQGKGAGSSMPLGLLNAPATLLQNRATASHFKLQDAAAMFSHLQIRSWDDACWLMHQSAIPDLVQMSDVSATAPGTAGQHFAWLPPYGNNKEGPAAMKLPTAFLNGLPLYFTEKVPALGTKGDVILADWSQYIVGQRLDIQIDVSPHYLFRNNQLAWRVIARCDGKPWLNGSITDAEGWSVSPFVVLN